MAFVSKLMTAPATLMLTLALLGGVCVVGCSEAETGADGGANESSTPESGSGQPTSPSGDGEMGSDDKEE